MDIIAKLKEIEQKIGRFPRHSDLRKLKEYNLQYKIAKSNKKLSDYAAEIGSIAARPRNYWSEDRLTKEFKSIYETYGCWPDSETIKNNYSTLFAYVHRLGKTVNYFLNKFDVNWKGTQNKKCCYCDKMFVPKLGKNRQRQKFCTNRCKINYHLAERNNKTRLRLSAPKICPICEKEFTPKTTTKQKYCQRSCFAKFRKKIDKATRTCLEATNSEKLTTNHKLLGYTPEQLLAHLKRHPNWEKCKNNWHLDHVFPIKAFIDRKIHDISIICCLENLQPLSPDENLKKSSQFDQKEFELWLNKHNIIHK